MPGRVLRHRTGALRLNGGALVMGIVNVTPDSFSDGGLNFAADDALRHGLVLVADGADILDVGGESTRPGHTPVDADTEWARIEPVLRGLAPSGAVLSVDTSKAVVARRAIGAGASLVNDVWGFQRDPDIAGVTAGSGAGAILMHNRESVDPALDIGDDILRFLERSVAIARGAGLADDRIALDPGIGFGKTAGQNFAALRALPRLRALGFPVLLGLSRKGFIGALSDPAKPPDERLAGTVAGNLYGVGAGADIIRVHDVAAHRQALAMLDRIERAA